MQRLPALPNAIDPSLHELDAVIKTGTPLTRQLHAAVPSLNGLTTDLGPFARQVQPTLRALGPVLAKGTATLKRSLPVSGAMREYAHTSRPAAELAGPLFTNLRDRGFSESLLLFLYRGAASAASNPRRSRAAVSRHSVDTRQIAHRRHRRRARR